MEHIVQMDGDQYELAIPNLKQAIQLNQRTIFPQLFFAYRDTRKTKQKTLQTCEMRYFRKPIFCLASDTDKAMLLPLLIPLDRDGKIEKIAAKNWSKAQAGSLYQDGQPIRQDNPIYDPAHPITIGDTIPGLELTWYYINGMLLAAQPIFLCTASILLEADLTEQKGQKR